MSPQIPRLAADIFAKHGEITSKMKFASGPGPSDCLSPRIFAADIFAKHGEIASKMKFAPGPGPSDSLGFLHPDKNALTHQSYHKPATCDYPTFTYTFILSTKTVVRRTAFAETSESAHSLGFSIFFIFNLPFKLYHHSHWRQHNRLLLPGLARHGAIYLRQFWLAL